MVISSDVKPSKYDFVYFIDENGFKVMGYVESVRSRPLLYSELPWNVATEVPINEKTTVTVARVRIVSEGTPRVGSWVYRASDSDVASLYAVPSNRALHVGFLASRPTVPIHLDLNALSRHLAIIAATGSGKTWTTIVLIEELLKKGATILVLDPHGEYARIRENVEEVGGSCLVLKAHSDQEGDVTYSIDLKSVDSDELAFVMGIPKNASRLRALLSSIREIAKEMYFQTKDPQWMNLEKLKELLSLTLEAANLSSHKQLQALFSSRNINVHENLVKRVWASIAKNAEVIYGLLKYVEELDRLGIYGTSSIPIGAFLRPSTVTVFNLSGIREEVQVHLVYNILKRIFNARVRHLRRLKGEKYPYPIEVIVEEAHRFAPPPSEGSPWTTSMIKRIASEGRKFGVFLTVITQRPSRVDQTVLSQCQSQIILRIVNPKDQQVVIESSEELGAALASDLPSLKPGMAMIVGPVVPKPALVRIRERKLEYGGGDLDLALEWSKAILTKERLMEIEEALRKLDLETVASVLKRPVTREDLEKAKGILVSERVYLDPRRNAVVFEECSVDLSELQSDCPKRAT